MIKRWYYGWQVILGLFINYMAIVGIMIYTLPLFYPSFIHDFGFTTEQVTRPAFVAYMGGAIITPFIAPFYDRYSIRKFMLAGTVFMVCGLLALSAFQTYAQMLAINLIFALAQVCAGQVPTMVVTTRWFNRRRGIAIGIVLTSTSVGGALFPLVVRQVMINGDWRMAIFVLMAICGMMMLLPLIFLIRNRPEDVGLKQTEADPVEIDDVRAGQLKDGPTLKQALRQPEFYLIAFATSGLWFCLNGLVQHQTILIGSELQIGIDSLTLVSSLFFTFAIIGKLVLGWLADRYNKIIIMFGAVLNLIAGLLILRLAHAGDISILYTYAVVYGLGYGGMFTMMQLVFAEFYAGKSYGRILGILTTANIGIGGLGIPAFGLMQGAFGSYMPVLEIMVGLNAVIAVTVLVLYRMRKAAAAITAASDVIS